MVRNRPVPCVNLCGDFVAVPCHTFPHECRYCGALTSGTCQARTQQRCGRWRVLVPWHCDVLRPLLGIYRVFLPAFLHVFPHHAKRRAPMLPEKARVARALISPLAGAGAQGIDQAFGLLGERLCPHVLGPERDPGHPSLRQAVEPGTDT